MATTSFATGNALTRKAWAGEVWKESKKQDFFSKFTSTSMNSIIQEKTELKKDKGDQVTFQLAMKLSNAGVTGDSTLEGLILAPMNGNIH